MSSWRCDYDRFIRIRDEEDLSGSLENTDVIEPATCHQDALFPSICAIEVSYSVEYAWSEELIMRVDRGSSEYLATTESVLHNLVPCEGDAIGTGKIKTKVTMCACIIVLFEIGSRTHQTRSKVTTWILLINTMFLDCPLSDGKNARKHSWHAWKIVDYFGQRRDYSHPHFINLQ